MIDALLVLLCFAAIIGGAVVHWGFKWRCEKLELQPAFDMDELLHLDALSLLGLIIAAAGVIGVVIYMAFAW